VVITFHPRTFTDGPATKGFLLNALALRIVDIEADVAYVPVYRRHPAKRDQVVPFFRWDMHRRRGSAILVNEAVSVFYIYRPGAEAWWQDQNRWEKL